MQSPNAQKVMPCYQWMHVTPLAGQSLAAVQPSLRQHTQMRGPAKATVSEDHVVEHSVPPVNHVEAVVLAVCIPVLCIVPKGPKMCIWPLPCHLEDGQDLHRSSPVSHAASKYERAAMSMVHCTCELRHAPLLV